MKFFVQIVCIMILCGTAGATSAMTEFEVSGILKWSILIPLIFIGMWVGEKIYVKVSKQNSLLANLVLTFFIFGGLLFFADIFYDQKSGDKALAICGNGNVKSVSTKGYFKRDIVCFNNAD